MFSVDFEMSFQVWFQWRPVTCWTLVRFLSCVCFHVFLQYWATVEWLGTLLARGWPLPCVASPLDSSVVRTLFLIRSLMHQQGPGATKGHSTHAAQVRPLVSCASWGAQSADSTVRLSCREDEKEFVRNLSPQYEQAWRPLSAVTSQLSSKWTLMPKSLMANVAG